MMLHAPRKYSVSFNLTGSESTSETSSVGAINPCQLMFLSREGFPNGLAKAIAQGGKHFPHRFWIIDNSETMNKLGGRMIINDSAEIIPSTRWGEIKECVTYHVQLAAQLFVPTTLKFLNHPSVGPQELPLAQRGIGDVYDELSLVNTVLDETQPSGNTPLTERILEVYDFVSSIATRLEQNDEKCVVIIATGGVPTDEIGCASKEAQEDFQNALKKLGSLPVFIILRLCTDDKKVLALYQKLDASLNLEVLDDYIAEAKEVYSKNPWINYGLPIHRARENGINDVVFDLIDERKLTTSELYSFCKLLFGDDSFDRVPHPDEDWIGFMHHMVRLNSIEDKTLNPIKNEVLPWIDLDKLHKMYGGGRGECQCIIS